MNPEKFIATLTRKQIRMLNSFAADAHRSDNLEKEVEADMYDEYAKAIHEEMKKNVENKLKGCFTDEDHIRTGEDYYNYLNNNRDKAMLTDEENERLMGMLSGFVKRKAETADDAEKK